MTLVQKGFQTSTAESNHKPEHSDRALSEHFAYLDDLRESGITNMWGAGAYLRDAFDLSKTEATTSHKLWMDTFDGKSSVAERVARAQTGGGQP